MTQSFDPAVASAASRPLRLPERTALLADLTGQSQQWLRLCADTVPSGPDALLALLDPADKWHQALTESGRFLPRPPGPSEKVEKVDVASARAVLDVARGLAGASDQRALAEKAMAHWYRTSLPTFDAGVPFPLPLLAGAGVRVRPFLDAVGSTSDPRRGFAVLLALRLANQLPETRRTVSVPVLFDRGVAGGSAFLHLSVLRTGPVGLHADPATACFFLCDDAFTQSVELAWEQSPMRRSGECVVWSVREAGAPVPDIRGRSLAAAFATGLWELHRLRRRRSRHSLRRFDRRTAVTGALAQDGRTLEPVDGYEKKFAAARTARLARVVVPRPAPTDPPLPVVERPAVETAATVDEAIAILRRAFNPSFLRSAAAATVIVVALAFGIFSFVRAQEAQDSATSARLRTAVDGLLSRTQSTVTNDPQTALRQAVAAHQLTGDQDAANAIVDIMSTTGFAGEASGHEGGVTSLAFASDQLMVTGGDDGTVVTWRIGEGAPRELARLAAHDGPVDQLVVSADGTVLGTASGGRRSAALWDLSDPTRPGPAGPRLSESDVVTALALSPDGQLAAVASSVGVTLVGVADPAAPRLLATQIPVGQPRPADNPADVLTFSPDGRRLAVGSSDLWPRSAGTGDGLVEFWDVTSGSQPRPSGVPVRTPGAPIWVGSFSPDGQVFATAHRQVALWDLTTTDHTLIGAPVSAHESGTPDLAFSPDGRHLATVGADGTSRVWAVDRQAGLAGSAAVHSAPRSAVTSVAFTPGSHHLATGGRDGRIVLSDLRVFGQPAAASPRLVAQPSGVAQLAFLGRTSTLVSAALDHGTLLTWDTSNVAAPVAGASMANQTRTASTLAVTSDGTLLAAGSSTGRVFLWDTTDPTAPRSLGVIETESTLVYSLDFAANGHLLATAGADGDITLWDLADPRNPAQAGRLDRAQRFTEAVFSHDSVVLVATDESDNITFWDIGDPTAPIQLAATLSSESGAVLSGDRRLLVVREGTSGVLWDLADAHNPRRIGLAAAGRARDSGLAVSADGRTLATASAGVVELWDLTDPARIGRIGSAPGSSQIRALSFSADGSRLAVAALDGTVLVRDLSRHGALRSAPDREACSVVAGGLDQDEWREQVPGVAFRETCPP